MLDYTYKTNRYYKLILNIYGITGSNKTIYITIAFLPDKKEKDFE